MKTKLYETFFRRPQPPTSRAGFHGKLVSFPGYDGNYNWVICYTVHPQRDPAFKDAVRALSRQEILQILQERNGDEDENNDVDDYEYDT